MKLLASLELSMIVLEKDGAFYAQIFDIESLNLAFEKKCETREEAVASIGSVVTGYLMKDH